MPSWKVHRKWDRWMFENHYKEETSNSILKIIDIPKQAGYELADHDWIHDEEQIDALIVELGQKYGTYGLLVANLHFVLDSLRDWLRKEYVRRKRKGARGMIRREVMDAVEDQSPDVDPGAVWRAALSRWREKIVTEETWGEDFPRWEAVEDVPPGKVRLAEPEEEALPKVQKYLDRNFDVEINPSYLCREAEKIRKGEMEITEDLRNGAKDFIKSTWCETATPWGEEVKEFMKKTCGSDTPEGFVFDNLKEVLDDLKTDIFR